MKCTDNFLVWINTLDRSLRIRIDQRIQRLADGNPGLHKRFSNLLEVKWKTGTMGSIRVYCAEIDGEVLLIGGNKSTQQKDIKIAVELLEGIKDGKIRIKNYE